MSKLTKSEKQELREMIKFKDGKVLDKDQLEIDLIQFCNDKYITKYKEKKDYQHIKPMQNFINSDGTATDHTVPEDNIYLEMVSVLLFQQSIKDRRERGIKTKNENKNLEPIAREDVGIKRQYLEFYQLNGQKIYVDKISSDDYSETSTTQFQVEQVYARDYNERELSIDNAINNLFDRYRVSENKNELLYKVLINLNKETLDYFSYEALVFFLNQELNHYHILSNQQRIIDRIILAGEVPDANQKKILRRALNIPKNIPKKND